MAHPQAPIRFENCNRSIYPHPQQLAADADNQQQHQQASVGIVGGNHAQIPQAVSVEHHQHIHQSSQDRQQLEPESLAVSDHNHCSVEAVALPAATQRLIATPPGLTHVEANIEWLRQLTEMMEGGSIDLSALGLTGGAVSGGGASSSASSSPTPSTTTLMQQQKQQQLTATSSLCATTDSNNNPIAAPSVTSHSGTKLDMNIQHTHQQQQSTTFPTSDPYGSSLLNDNANRNISNLAQQQMDTNNFITGAISNRTLEQLTECMNRQGNGSGISGGNGRAVRGIDHHQQYGNATSTNNSNGTSQGSDGNGNNIQQQDGTSQIDRISRALYQQSLLGSVGGGNVGGSIGLDKPQAPPVYLGPPGFTDTATAAQYARSPSPSDSDTSGFGSECSADSAIIDLMNSLNILPTQMNQHVAQQAQQHQNQQHQHVLTASQAAALYNNQQQVINAQLQAAQQQALLQQQLAQQQQQHQSLSSLMSPASGSYLGGGSSDTHAELLRALGLQMTPGGGFVAAGHPTSAATVHQQQQQHQALHHQHSHQQQHQQQGHRAASIAAAAAAAQSALDTELLLAGEQFYDKHWNNLNSLFSTSNSDPYSIERAAKLYRNAASVCEATCTWSGQFPPRIYKNPIYSPKVFLGGVPWDITEAGLQASFRAFGPMKIEWPGKDGKHPRYPTKAGYVYILFENDKSVKALLQSCTHDFSNGGEYYFKISSRRMRSKEVQVIPWVLSDSNFVRQSSQRLDPSKTVFVGALHGMMNAEGLAHIMNDLFGNVVYAGIDTDKHKYPIGSGRVTFSTHKSYMKAVNAAFVEVKASKFTKKLQIDPYLEDSLCGSCCLNQGPFFCRDMTCFRYYCRTCWQWAHSMDATKHHKPLMRNSRTQQNQSQQSQSQNTPISATQAASLLDVLSPQTATPTHMSLNRQQAAAAAAVVPGSGATTATLGGGGNVTPLAGATTAHSHPAAQASPGANIAQPQASLSTMLQQQQQQQQAAQLLAQQQLQQSILSTLGQ